MKKKEEDFFNNLIGQDTYDINEKRAPKHSLTLYIFILLNDLNNLKYKVNEKLQLSFENKIDLIKLTVDSSTTKNISLKDIAKIIAIDKNNISGYRIDKDEKPLFTKFESINTIRHFLNKNNIDIS
ncbi:CRISPR-associated endonuclease Cas9 REC1/REC2 domain-containing protein [Spiroplasma endosymbiont of Seladonia tumulorum]|uniref:CRISPR-associated endonuclease Cas9 REC1/REC2 domain-containing protein n=1 Tax=Spiroplasma endosymbiont of Seladonia tumulorum TaxID=3066321 RepID=UPI0030D46223